MQGTYIILTFRVVKKKKPKEINLNTLYLTQYAHNIITATCDFNMRYFICIFHTRALECSVYFTQPNSLWIYQISSTLKPCIASDYCTGYHRLKAKTKATLPGFKSQTYH